MTPRPTPFTKITLPILPGREETVQRQKKRDEWEDQTRHTSFPEYIEYCHDYLFKPLQIDTYEILQPIVLTANQLQQRDLTLCPTNLRPWGNFEQLQREAYEEVLETLGSRECFPPKNSIIDEGEQLCDEQLQTEEDLLIHQKYAVEKPVEAVVQELLSSARQGSGLTSFDLNLEGGIMFDHKDDGKSPQVAAVRGGKLKPMLFYIKDNHRMTPENLRVGLRQQYPWDKVVNRSQVAVGLNERLVFQAEYMTVSALAQAYDAMMHGGTPYGVLATGSCLVFLHVADGDPETLYYFLSEPTLDVQTMIRIGYRNWMKKPVTAVGRILALCLMSTLQPIRGQNWHGSVLPRINKLAHDFNWVFTHIPQEELVYAPPASEYKPLGFRGAPSAPVAPATRWPQPAPPEISFEFCTEKCLLGLQKKGVLDINCPNVQRHRAGRAARYHQIDSADMVRKLTQQLERDMEQYCHVVDPRSERELRKAWGLLFKLTLVPYGYTVVGKGSTEQGWDGLDHEEEVYSNLQPIQGRDVPVFLGSLHPNRPYVVGRIWFSHFLLLSWSGQALDSEGLMGHFPKFVDAMRHVHAHGVDMGLISIPPSNLLWSEERGTLEMIGFRRSKVVKQWKELGKRKKRDKDEGAAKRRHLEVRLLPRS